MSLLFDVSPPVFKGYTVIIPTEVINHTPTIPTEPDVQNSQREPLLIINFIQRGVKLIEYERK